MKQQQQQQQFYQESTMKMTKQQRNQQQQQHRSTISKTFHTILSFPHNLVMSPTSVTTTTDSASTTRRLSDSSIGTIVTSVPLRDNTTTKSSRYNHHHNERLRRYLNLQRNDNDETTTISSSQSEKVGSVRFNPRVKVYQSKHSTPLTDIEKRQLFYNRSDYHRIEHEVAECITTGYPLHYDDDQQHHHIDAKTAACVRGLETFYGTRAYKVAMLQRQTIVEAILKEQMEFAKEQKSQQQQQEQAPSTRKQRRTRSDSDPADREQLTNRIAAVSMQISRLDKLKARQIAQRDAEAVRDETATAMNSANAGTNSLTSTSSMNQPSNNIQVHQRQRRRNSLPNGSVPLSSVPEQHPSSASTAVTSTASVMPTMTYSPVSQSSRVRQRTIATELDNLPMESLLTTNSPAVSYMEKFDSSINYDNKNYSHCCRRGRQRMIRMSSRGSEEANNDDHSDNNEQSYSSSMDYYSCVDEVPAVGSNQHSSISSLESAIMLTPNEYESNITPRQRTIKSLPDHVFDQLTLLEI